LQTQEEKSSANRVGGSGDLHTHNPSSQLEHAEKRKGEESIDSTYQSIFNINIQETPGETERNSTLTKPFEKSATIGCFRENDTMSSCLAMRTQIWDNNSRCPATMAFHCQVRTPIKGPLASLGIAFTIGCSSEQHVLASLTGMTAPTTALH